MLIPLVRIHWSSGTEYYAFEGVRTPAAFYRDLLMQISPITREVPAVPSGYRVSSGSVTLSNVTGHFSALRDAVPFLNVQVDLLFGDTDEGLASFIPLFCGRITKDWEITPRTCQLPLRDHSYDRFLTKIGKYINPNDFVNLPADSPWYLKPIIYGNVSSFASGSNIGGTPCYLVDASGPYKYLVARHACKSIDRVYNYEAFIDGAHALTGYTVTEETIDGETHTFLNFTPDPRNADRPQEFEIRADVQGMTDTGLSSGTLITNPMEQLRSYLLTFADLDLADINAAIWDEAVDAADELGYEGAFAILRKDTAHIDVIDRFIESFSSPFYSDREGKFAIFLFSFEQLGELDQAGMDVLTDEGDILRNSFRVLGPEEVATRMQYNYAYQWVRDYFEFQPDEISDTQETALGQVLRQNVNLWYVRNAITARDVAQERLYWHHESQQFLAFHLPISEFNRDLNNYVKVTHFRGVGASGYSETVARLIALRLDVQPKSMTVSALGMRVFKSDQFWLRYIKLGDEDEISADWNTASDADKEYGYLGDEADFTGSPEGTLGAADEIKLLF